MYFEHITNMLNFHKQYRKFRTVIISILLFFPILNIQAFNSDSVHGLNKTIWHNYEPQQVKLRGTIAEEKSYGPPNYGEDPNIDKIEKYYILKLDDPINVKGKTNSKLNSETELNISEIQLSINWDNKNNILPNGDIANILNKKVSVKGTLFHSVTGHHHTKVLLNVTKIKLIPR